MKWMLGVVLALGLTGCSWQDDVKVRGEGAVVEQQHPLGHEVTRVLAGVPANLYLVAGESHTLRVKGEANLLPYLVLTEKGEKLEIEVKDGYRLDPTQPLEITITLPTLGGYNGDAEKPTFTPSVLVTYNGSDAGKDGAPPSVCHSFVTDGRIQFLADCTHALAGQTVGLPDFEGEVS